MRVSEGPVNRSPAAARRRRFVAALIVVATFAAVSVVLGADPLFAGCGAGAAAESARPR